MISISFRRLLILYRCELVVKWSSLFHTLAVIVVQIPPWGIWPCVSALLSLFIDKKRVFESIKLPRSVLLHTLRSLYFFLPRLLLRFRLIKILTYFTAHRWLRGKLRISRVTEVLFIIRLRTIVIFSAFIFYLLRLSLFPHFRVQVVHDGWCLSKLFFIGRFLKYV